MTTALRLLGLVLVTLVLVSACSLASTNNGPGSTTNDPVVAHWVLSSVTNAVGGSQTPLSAGISEDVVFNADRSCIIGIAPSGAWGSSTMVAVGTWTAGGSGTYSVTAYPSGGTGSSAVTETVTLGGSTLSAPVSSGPPGGPYTFTFTKSSVAVASSDLLAGAWTLNSVKDGNGTVQAPGAAGMAETAAFEGDSSFLFGQQVSTSTMCGMGIWTPGSSGSYSFTAYPSGGTSTAAGSGSLGGSILTIPNLTLGTGVDPHTFTFVKNSTSISSTDAVLGAWTLSSVTDNSNSTQTPLSAGLAQVLVFQADGALLFGFQGGAAWGNQSLSGVGFWTPGSPGNYTYTAYPSGGSTASTGTLSVGGSVLTVSGVSGGSNPPYTLTFTRM